MAITPPRLIAMQVMASSKPLVPNRILMVRNPIHQEQQRADAGPRPRLLHVVCKGESYFPSSSLKFENWISLVEAPPLRRRPPIPGGTLLLAAEGVSKRFGGLVAVNDLSFELRAGEILGLIGPNGSGKTTLVNLITGLERRDHGTIGFRGRDIGVLPPFRITRLGIARSSVYRLLGEG